MTVVQPDKIASAAPWVIPANLPLKHLKSLDLEECVYWLLDAMGATELEWRVGGTGSGAADGGRDLDAIFYSPSDLGEMKRQRWWVECKGRSSTLETEAVKVAANNALVQSDLDHLVVATNTGFTNPTRDWIEKWQLAHPRPRVHLWDGPVLERLLSQQPQVVLRLFAGALSAEGRLKATEHQFWERIEYASPDTLSSLWDARRSLAIEPYAVFACIAGEFANGSITDRPWAAELSDDELKTTFLFAAANVIYLVHRSHLGGRDTGPIQRALSYVLLAVLQVADPEWVARGLLALTGRDEQTVLPENAREFLLMPILDQLQGELQEVCASSCSRMITTREQLRTSDGDEIERYWERLQRGGRATKTKQSQWLLLEKEDEPCRVGFEVSSQKSCPLFSLKSELSNVEAIVAVLHRVSRYRRTNAIKERA